MKITQNQQQQQKLLTISELLKARRATQRADTRIVPSASNYCTKVQSFFFVIMT